MNAYLLILPAALLVAYSQLIVKWRTTSHGFSSEVGAGMVSYLVKFFSDPMILSAYAAALMGSVVWLFIVAKLPLTFFFFALGESVYPLTGWLVAPGVVPLDAVDREQHTRAIGGVEVRPSPLVAPSVNGSPDRR